MSLGQLWTTTVTRLAVGSLSGSSPASQVLVLYTSMAEYSEPTVTYSYLIRLEPESKIKIYALCIAGV